MNANTQMGRSQMIREIEEHWADQITEWALRDREGLLVWLRSYMGPLDKLDDAQLQHLYRQDVLGETEGP